MFEMRSGFVVCLHVQLRRKQTHRAECLGLRIQELRMMNQERER